MAMSEKNNQEMIMIRERSLRERERILREFSPSIDSLSLQAFAFIEDKYKNLHGENWRNSLSTDEISRIEQVIKNEKADAVVRIQNYICELKSFESSSLRR